MNIESKKHHKNIPKIYAYSFFYMFLILIPVIVPYFLTLNLDMEDIFIIQASFGVMMAIFEVPSAYIGDLWGRKNILVLGSFISGCGFTLLLWAHDFWSLMFYEMVLAMGASFVSGADLALLYDSIKGERFVKAKAISRYYSLHLFGEATAAIICGYLMLEGFKRVINVQVIVGWIPFLITLFLVEAPIEKMDKNAHKENLKEVFNFIFKGELQLRLVFINMVVWSLSTFCAVWLLQKYWLQIGYKEGQLGHIWASMHLITAFFAATTLRIDKWLGRKAILVVMAIIPITSYITMSFSIGIIGLVATTGFYISRGINSVIMKESFNHAIPDKFRNTANSLVSLFFRGSFFFIGPAIGFLIDRYGMNTALQVLGGVFGICLFLIMIPYIRLINRQNSNAN